jgi:hypothetical protein
MTGDPTSGISCGFEIKGQTSSWNVCGGGGRRRGTPDIPLYILFLDDGVHCFSTFVYVLRICNRLKRQQLFLVLYATVQLVLV